MTVIERIGRSTPFRFLLAGGCATAVNWSARCVLGTALPFTASVVAAYGVGMVAGFVLYRAFVFTGSTRRPRQQLGPFIAVNLASVALVTLSAASVLPLVSALGLSNSVAEGCAHAIALALGAVLNFTGHKRVTFSTAPQSA